MILTMIIYLDMILYVIYLNYSLNSKMKNVLTLLKDISAKTAFNKHAISKPSN